MSVGSLVAILVVVVGLGEKGTMSDGSVGSVMDRGDDVRRIDLGSHTYVAQQAEEQLTAEGFACRAVSVEQGAFGIGLGDHHYLVYNAPDEDRVRQVVDVLLADIDMSLADLDTE